MGKKSPGIAPTNWQQYIYDHGLSELKTGNQSRTFRSGKVVIKVPRRNIVADAVFRKEMWWHRVHRDGVKMLGELAIPFEFCEQNLRVTFRKKFLALFPYSADEEHSSYVVQADTGDTPTLSESMRELQSFKKALADLSAFTKSCLMHGVFLNDMIPDNFVYWKGRLSLRDIGAIVIDIDRTRKLIETKKRLPDPNVLCFHVLASTHFPNILEARQAVDEFSVHMQTYLSLASVDTMRKHQHTTRAVQKVKL